MKIRILLRFEKLTFLFGFILYLLQIPSLFAQALLEDAMLVPVGFINIDDSGVQKSIDNFIRAELSKNYFLKSRDEVLEAMEKAADDADSTNCSEEACIKIMEEILDVEYTFKFEIILIKFFELSSIIFESLFLPDLSIERKLGLSKLNA